MTTGQIQSGQQVVLIFLNQRIEVPQGSFFSALKNLYMTYMSCCKCERNQRRGDFDSFYLTIKNGLAQEDAAFIKAALNTSSVRFLIGDELLLEV